MKTKSLVLALALALGAGAPFAAMKYGHIEPVKASPAAASDAVAIPRVVVTAKRPAADEAPVARIVVTAPRIKA